MFTRRELLRMLSAASLAGGFTTHARQKPGEISETEQYPAPRWPSYVKTASTVDQVMPFARALASNPSGEFGGSGLGVLQPGESALIVIPSTAEDVVIEAVRRAVKERGVNVTILTLRTVHNPIPFATSSTNSEFSQPCRLLSSLPSLERFATMFQPATAPDVECA